MVTQYAQIYEEVLKMEASGQQVRPILSSDSKKGASYSIRAGVEGAKKGVQGYAFFVADQPYLTERSAKGFLEEMERRGAALGSVRCKERLGNPTWFSVQYRKELLALSGDSGGRKVMKRHPGEVVYYEIGDERELEDIDEPCKL